MKTHVLSHRGAGAELPTTTGLPMYTTPTDENLDPRRRQRGLRTRDFQSASRSVSIPSLPQLLARALVRLGLVR